MRSQNGHEGWEAAGMSPLGVEMSSVENARVVPTPLYAQGPGFGSGQHADRDRVRDSVDARHETFVVGSSSPIASCVSADNVAVCPTRSEAVRGAIVARAMPPGNTVTT